MKTSFVRRGLIDAVSPRVVGQSKRLVAEASGVRRSVSTRDDTTASIGVHNKQFYIIVLHYKPQRMSSTVISGQCACGEVSWSSTEAPEHLDFCYCTTCQQTSGAPFAPWIGITKSAISWKGEMPSWRPTIGDGDTSVSTRTFCSDCGSCMAIQYDFYPNKTHIAAGTATVGANTIPKVCMHLYLKKAPRWYQIPEGGVARYDELPEDFMEVWEKHKREKS